MTQLETDPAILIPKARVAIERYGHQIVVGNLLTTRKHEVVFVTKDEENWLRIPQAAPMAADGANHEIEEDIIEHLTQLHEKWADGAALSVK